jgi:hypothetical protein
MFNENNFYYSLFNYSKVPGDDDIFTIKILALNVKRKNFKYMNVEFTSVNNPDIKLICCIVERYNVLLFIGLVEALPNDLQTIIPEGGLEISREILATTYQIIRTLTLGADEDWCID